MAGTLTTSATNVLNAVMQIPMLIFTSLELVAFYAALDMGMAFVMQMIPKMGARGSLQNTLVESIMQGVVDVAKIGGFELVKPSLSAF
jgi:hypothetical protein